MNCDVDKYIKTTTKCSYLIKCENCNCCIVCLQKCRLHILEERMLKQDKKFKIIEERIKRMVKINGL